MRSVWELSYGNFTLPCIGLGTYGRNESELLKIITNTNASQLMLDTANRYGNEIEVGRAIKNSGLDRERFYIIGKMSREQSYQMGVREAVKETMRNLGVTYLDVYMLHSPRLKNIPELFCELIGLKSEGVIRNTGVSGFSINEMNDLYNHHGVYPDIHQFVLVDSGQKDYFLKAHNTVGIVPMVAQPFGGYSHSIAYRQMVLSFYADNNIPVIIGTHCADHLIETIAFMNNRYQYSRNVLM